MPRLTTAAATALLTLCVTAAAFGQNANDNVGHERHKHHHNPKHVTEAPTPARFITNRSSDVVLPLPAEKDAFMFVVYGDRTGGPTDGVKVLADAVHDTNLLEPDLVMTVGDLINGYNDTQQWTEQMLEFKGVMNELRCPWFPVAGNHDVYWRDRGRGEAKPVNEHDANFEMHFGPLWYAFEHKNSWFISLFSDETNPKTGEKNFNKPANHVMSEEQFTWLGEMLDTAKAADHVFIFIHHPRWTGGNYGDDWNRVHELLVKAGNVTAVFAGHIHRMRYDPKDGIEYVTLATVGGNQDGTVPDAGWLHQFHVVTVRKQQVAMASLPVGEVMDVRELTGELAGECAAQAAKWPDFDGSLAFTETGGVEGTFGATLENVTSRAIEVTVAPDSGDSRWRFEPDHAHVRIEPGAKQEIGFAIERSSGELDGTYRPLELVLNTDVLMPGHRYSLLEKRAPVPVDAGTLPGPAVAAEERALYLDGDDAVMIPDREMNLPFGPFTLEAWANAAAFGDRTGLVCKTEVSDYGIFVSNGLPEFSVFLNGKYAAVRADKAMPTGVWTHVAGVFDGEEIRLYVDGVLVKSVKATGLRKPNALPLVIGADVASNGQPESFFKGAIDGVRLSKRAVYSGESFTPARRLTPDDDTVLLTNMDGFLGRSLWSEGPRRTIGTVVGNPVIR